MWGLIIFLFMDSFHILDGAINQSQDCRDKEMICKLLMESIPNFCLQAQNKYYVTENCQQSCRICAVKQASFRHSTNLIWAQTPLEKVYTVSRLVAIQGDPSTWVRDRKPQVTYISAPHYTWEFRALAFHWEDETLYWSESMNKKIQSLVLNGSTDTRSLFAGTSSEVYGIAVDWFSRNVYFTDALYNWIMMTSTNPDQPVYKIVVQERLDSPHGLAVHPQKGYLIWSDWGERPKIEMADLVGENRRTLVERDIVQPRGLTIDYTSNDLYWVDSHKATIEVVKFNGQGRKVIHQEESSSFYGVAMFEDFIFVTEQSRSMLKVFNHRQSLVSFTLGNDPFDILMYDSSRQPGSSNECQELACEHLCVVDPLTGAKCLCGEGFVPLDNSSSTCQPSLRFVHPSHIYAIRDSICQYPANLADMSLANVTLDTQCFLEDKQGYMTLTYDARENVIYFFGNQTKLISQLPLELGGKSKVVTGGTGVVKGMALDWVSGNLYWTDSTLGHIKVSRKSGAFQRVVLDNLTHPVGIAVHPGKGQIFWTDHGRSPDISGRVESAYMDGSGREIIMADNIGQPNHLFIDFQKDFLYWADSVMNHIRQVDLTTGQITVVYEQPMVRFYGLSVFKDYILWTDTDDLNGIHVARLDKKEKVRGIIHPRNGLAADLITFDIQNQPDFNNTCKEGTSVCSQLCLMSQNSSRCFCGVGFELSKDGFTCVTSVTMDNFLLVNDAYQKQIFQLDVETSEVQALNLHMEHEPIALSYDPFEVKVFWSENKVNVIKEATIDGKFEKTVLLLNDASVCDGLAADYINKLLFFTDTGNNVIGVVSMLRYEFYTNIITQELDEPRDIVVSPNQGIIYWTDWGKSPKIEKANMDGSGREVILSLVAKSWPNGLTLDLQDNQLYWVDAFHDQISVIDLATKNVTILKMEPEAHYFSIDVIGQFLYLADWKTNYIRRMNKKGGQLEKFGPAIFSRLYGIRGYNSSESFKGISVCASSACEQLCLPKSGNLYTCRCTEGFTSEGPQCLQKSSTESPLTLPWTRGASSIGSSSQTSPIINRSDTSPFITTSKTSTVITTRGTSPQPTTLSPPATSPRDVPTSPQSTSSVSSYISPNLKISTMLSSKESDVSSSGDITTTITSARYFSSERNSPTTTSPGVSVSSISWVDGSNATTLMLKAEGSSSFLSPTMIGLLAACGILILVALAVFAALAYKRRYMYAFRHGKLLEEKAPSDFYTIAFPSRDEDNVTFDSGIENPIYDCLHDPFNNMEANSDGSPT